MNKKDVKGFEFKERAYKPKKKETEFVCELDTRDDIQIIRIFKVSKEKCVEVQRTYINEDGEELIMSYGTWCNQYSIKFDLKTNFKFRDRRKIIIYPHKIVVKNILDKYKKFIDARLLNINCIDIVEYLYYLHDRCLNTPEESLASLDLSMFLKVFNILNHSYTSSLNNLNLYLRPLQLIHKWGYKVKDWRMYLDHLDMLNFMGYDIRNPKYIAPKNLVKAHDELNRKKTAYEFKPTKEQAQKYLDNVKKHHLYNFQKTVDGITIKALNNVKEVEHEGHVQENCLYRCKYYTRLNSLLFTSFIGERKLETIEYSIKDKKVVQCYAKHNSCSELHDEVIRISNEVIRKQLGA